MADEGIDVEVVYGTSAGQSLRQLHVRTGASVLDAIEVSGMLEQFPEIRIDSARVGIFGKAVTLDAVLRNGDRVEIYRELITTPKEARRRRAGK